MFTPKFDSQGYQVNKNYKVPSGSKGVFFFFNVYMQIMIKSFLVRKDKSFLAFFGSLCGAATSMPV